MEGGKKEKITEFPVGYRFMPTDSELLYHYLTNKVLGLPLPCDKIKEINISKFNPEELSDKYKCGDEKDLYFFTPREKKYQKGSRPNRAAGDGYWKASGADKKIKYGDDLVGFKKALGFYRGKPNNGVNTGWIMQEYRVTENITRDRPQRNNKDMALDWVLCRIYYNTKIANKALNSNVNYPLIQKNNTQEINYYNCMPSNPQPALNSNKNYPLIQKNNTQELNDCNGMPPISQPVLNSIEDCPFIRENNTQELNDCNGMHPISQPVLNSIEDCPFIRENNTEQIDVLNSIEDLDNELEDLFNLLYSPRNDIMWMNF